MFCYQCEQARGQSGCNVDVGTCGKDATTALLQDALNRGVLACATLAHHIPDAQINPMAIGRHLTHLMFFTVTNVNFDNSVHVNELNILASHHKNLTKKFENQFAGQPLPPGAEWSTADNEADWLIEAQALEITQRAGRNPDQISLEETIFYGLKGAAAYAVHAARLGQESLEVYKKFIELLTFIASPQPMDQLVANTLAAGALNLQVMEMLDRGHTTTFGHPEPTVVSTTGKKGKAILISGHDLVDLEALLKQTEGKGINVYTHSEMLPGLAYPGLKKYKHLAGNWGGAWQDQQKEFAAFPGAIVLTTNCLQAPKPAYQDRIFTMNEVGWKNMQHLPEPDFTPVIEAALAQTGFEQDEPTKNITIGFGHNAVLSVADKVVEAVKTGAIKHFFLVGGCDGARPGRNYYTNFVEQVPQDCVVLTLACGKYRFNKMELGEIGGLPRLMDVGQCNDAYSAIKIASALADAFGTDVNGLPLSMVLSWFEQKAVAILLTLLHLGIKDIRLGPTLPAFITPGVLQVLSDSFGLRPITTPEADLEAILA